MTGRLTVAATPCIDVAATGLSGTKLVPAGQWVPDVAKTELGTLATVGPLIAGGMKVPSGSPGRFVNPSEEKRGKF